MAGDRNDGDLGPRLEAVASLVPEGSTVADIGSDHGLLPSELVRRGRARRCIASDKHRPGISRDRADPGVDVRSGHGLDVLRAADGVDVVTLSGMGARTILSILDAGRISLLGIRRLVLQPQTEPASVRRWVARHDWRIVAERMVRERGYDYTVIAAEPGTPFAEPHPRLSHDDLCEAGPCLVRDGEPVMRNHWANELERLERIAVRRGTEKLGGRVASRIRLARRVLAALDDGSRYGSERLV